jgi:hypothetical protein
MDAWNTGEQRDGEQSGRDHGRYASSHGAEPMLAR